MGRWDKYDVCPDCGAPTGTRCWVIVRGPDGPGGVRTSRVTQEPANRRHDRRPLLSTAAAA